MVFCLVRHRENSPLPYLEHSCFLGFPQYNVKVR